jgi:para-nitrobenzyl esterase
VIEPYVLPVAPYEAFSSGTQNDVPLLLGSNTEEARAMVDASHLKAADSEASIERGFGSLPTEIVAAYPHTTEREARQARIDLETDRRFGWDMWAWVRLQAGTGITLSTTTRFASSRRFGRICLRGMGRKSLR